MRRSCSVFWGLAWVWLGAGLCLAMASKVVAQESDLPRVGQPATFQISEVDATTFVVYRQRAVGPGIEGFVVDRQALLEQLRSRVLEEQGLGALAQVGAVGQPTGRGRGSAERAYLGFESAYTFTHRFAQPFADLEAQLDLAPLQAGGLPDGVLYIVLWLLGLAIVAGLFALYRMVATQVRFATKRNNFVAAVSHELKTPLTAIRMYGEVLRDDLLESEAKRKEYYAIICSETERLSRLINNVLEFSRLERKDRQLQLRTGSVAAVCEEVVELFQPHATQQGFALRLVAEKQLPRVRLDPDALTQVLFNLMDNSLKYGRSQEEDPYIEVRCESLPGRHGVRVVVADGGPGVEPAHLDEIFKPFYRVQDELTRSQQGTGIGLALVFDLVARMHGQVEGRNGNPGFQVRVTLPAAPQS